MCRSGQGTTVVVRQRKIVNKLSFYDDKDNQWVKSGFCSGPNHPKSESVCFRKGQKETKGLSRRKAGRQDPHSSLLGGRQVPIQGGGCWLPSKFDCTVNTGAQIPEDVEQPFFLSLAFCLVWVKNKRNFLWLVLPSFPFHSIPFFLRNWTTFCFQLYLFISGVCDFLGVSVMWFLL